MHTVFGQAEDTEYFRASACRHASKGKEASCTECVRNCSLLLSPYVVQLVNASRRGRKIRKARFLGSWLPPAVLAKIATAMEKEERARKREHTTQWLIKWLIDTRAKIKGSELERKLAPRQKTFNQCLGKRVCAKPLVDKLPFCALLSFGAITPCRVSLWFSENWHATTEHVLFSY